MSESTLSDSVWQRLVESFGEGESSAAASWQGHFSKSCVHHEKRQEYDSHACRRRPPACTSLPCTRGSRLCICFTVFERAAIRKSAVAGHPEASSGEAGSDTGRSQSVESPFIANEVVACARYRRLYPDLTSS
jgi:hypothetical protein